VINQIVAIEFPTTRAGLAGSGIVSSVEPASYVRDDRATMVWLDEHCYVNDLYRDARSGGRPSDERIMILFAAAPKIGLLEFLSKRWRPAMRTTSDARFTCVDGFDDSAKVKCPTAWLNGAGLLTETLEGFGIVGKQRPRYAKLKMKGVPRTVPQPKPLLHTLWDHISHVQTVFDLREVVSHRDDAAFDSKAAILKQIEDAAARGEVLVWQRLPVHGTVTVINPNRRLIRRPYVRVIDTTTAASQDWSAAFRVRMATGWEYRIQLRNTALVVRELMARVPGGEGLYTPRWYRDHQWINRGSPPKFEIFYNGSRGQNECQEGVRHANGWPFARMRSRGISEDLFNAGCAHLNYAATSGMHGSPLGTFAPPTLSQLADRGPDNRMEGRRKVYMSGVDALRKRLVLTRKPIVAVVEGVLFGDHTIADLRYLSTYRNNSYASREIMRILCDGLSVLDDHYRCSGDWEEKSTSAVGEREEGDTSSETPWPRHWSRCLREFKYREEKEIREALSDTKPGFLPLIYKGENSPYQPGDDQAETNPQQLDALDRGIARLETKLAMLSATEGATAVKVVAMADALDVQSELAMLRTVLAALQKKISACDERAPRSGDRSQPTQSNEGGRAPRRSSLN
jgi:hypothetical protein